MQTQLLELCEFQPISSLDCQEEIKKQFCSFQIREEGAKLNSSTQNVIGYELALLLDTTQLEGGSDDVSKLTIKEAFKVCRVNSRCANWPLGRRELAQGTCNVSSSGDQVQGTIRQLQWSAG